MEPGNASDFVGGLSTLLKSASSIQEGYATESAYKQAAKSSLAEGQFEAAQYKQRAGQSRAAAQRDAFQERRQTKLAISKAQATAAASGAGPVPVIQASLAGQGMYNALMALYNGEEQARGDEASAAGAIFNSKNKSQGYKMTGGAARDAGYQEAAGHILDYGATFLDKYGDSTDDTEKPLGSYGSAHGGRKVNF